MKKLVILLAVALVFLSCKTSSVTNTKLDRGSQVQIKGDWQISNVTIPGAGAITITSFEIADSKCFIGSSWHFISNNNKGTMQLTANNCPAYTSPITWFINKNGEFVLKFLNTEKKAKRVRDGFVLQIRNQTATTFQLVDRANVDGQTKEVVYQFTKNN